MRTNRLPLRVVLVAMAPLLACTGGDAANPSSRTVDTVLVELATAGLVVEDAREADGAALGGGACKRGLVRGVEVTLCRYQDPAAARAAEPAGLTVVGETTGTALARGPLLLVVADRAGKDREGKTIDAVTRAFLQRPARTPS